MTCMEYDRKAEELGIVVDSPGWLIAANEKLGPRPSGPRRTASVRCESGKRDYCTCDTCF